MDGQRSIASELHDIWVKHGRYFAQHRDSAIAEGLALFAAARKMTIPITDQHLVSWKQGRGFHSSMDMMNNLARDNWLKWARAVVALA